MLTVKTNCSLDINFRFTYNKTFVKTLGNPSRQELLHAGAENAPSPCHQEVQVYHDGGHRLPACRGRSHRGIQGRLQGRVRG